ncbi:hypothetical protein OG352_03940 [Streptomyces sp. NBC_01485]|uniref:hypothetical protein n=1 Tax=Streptomyces sp. NBC_01485 TaxID=2903884 RepID=UPI002E358B8F|nr:hypothetical protein [Streptomyces sp. NBC_01485]
MNMPFDGTAGSPEGRPQVRAVHRPADPAEAYLREVALFVALHLGRAPGVLWPEHDHPLLGDGDGADDGEDPAATPDLDALAAQIAAATRLPARPAPVGVPPGHLLVHQIAGAATWNIAGAGADGQGASLRYRLRVGEVLYVPDGWSRTAEPAADARWTVVVLAPDGPDRP